MPKKSRRAKTLQYQRKQERPLATATRDTPVVVPSGETAPPVAPSAVAPTPRKAAAGIRYPYVAAELQRIGLLAGIILVILVVLALVLS